ncbi:MAG: hypothetical protein IPM71_00125 [Bacteroidota bacterium]|nr:MAG: hypothetical protein IPM71_00125 [Bacteroidota bacterium]
MAITKVLITVKTYPAISKKYEELVCTAGFREDGTWIRIYPIQFRKKSYNEQYSKYQWIEVDLVKNKSDFRPESYRPVSHETEIKIVGEIKADGNTWTERRKIVLNKVYDNLSTLISEAKDKETCTSLAVFKPTKIIDFVWKEVERNWTKDKIAQFQQLNLFQNVNDKKFEVVKKLPYKFSFVFEDINGKRSTTMIEDWETGQLYWNCFRNHDGDELKACQDVRKKYFDDFSKTKDLHFFLGTAQTHHFTGKNPFMIIGTFHPKKLEQLSLF